ncbi:MAG: sigma-54 dependent transcriptional regulator [Planctomycetota bacterium]
MNQSAHVLVVDDEVETLRTLADALLDLGFECTTARSGRDALRVLEGNDRVDVLFTDLMMPGMHGLELVKRVRARWGDVQVVILTAFPTTDTALLGGQLGVARYMTKPASADELGRALSALSLETIVSETSDSDAVRSGAVGSSDFCGIVGRHHSMQELRQTIEKYSDVSATVFIQGESGCGKELVARAIHQSGPRAKKKFLALNCAAIQPNLLESQLFGHVAGAFTGANKDHTGLFVAAGDGTLFLDEVAEMPLELQVKILRSLQEMEVTPVGSNRSQKWSARVLCATNVDIDAAVADGRFREDLYYRLNVLRVRVPPLRERRSDIPLLANWFVEKHSDPARRRPKLSGEVIEALGNHDWPGNIRQLENEMIRLLALSSGGTLQVSDLPVELRPKSPIGVFPTYEEVTRDHIIRALDQAKGVQTVAARLLGIDRNRLARMMKRYGIQRDAPSDGASRN